ncbi:hypothetical protein JYU34_003939 [Plutella xylostella]|uniref:Uncharacterized protein n=1 Tax=Plutella xylostella TaxID=51655 RepID=A0ABQ7R195_PLUXY|nr:hypothetical protein JYU34_003939 [Plutella xylostella]
MAAISVALIIIICFLQVAPRDFARRCQTASESSRNITLCSGGGGGGGGRLQRNA